MRGYSKLMIVLWVVAAACGPDSQVEIETFVLELPHEGDTLTNTQDTGSGPVAETVIEEPKEELVSDRNGEMICTRTKYSLKANFDKIAILRPAQETVWPGAIVKVNQDMIDGLPDPVNLPRPPIRLSLDLPGIGGYQNGEILVEDPSRSTAATAIDNALRWWNDNAYQEGYRNPSNYSFLYDVAYDKNQIGIKTGTNVAWAGGEVSGALDMTRTSEQRVVAGAFHQGFYTVTYDTPDLKRVFAEGVGLEDVRSAVGPDSLLGYIGEVVYGRIILVRMETSNSVSASDAKAAFAYSGGAASAGGSIEVHLQSILEKSRFSVLSIGGSAEGAAQLLDVDHEEGALKEAIKSGMVYTRDNPGVPIAYTVRYLGKDNSLAKLGYHTEYTTTECERAQDQVTVHFESFTINQKCRAVDANFYWEVGVDRDGAPAFSKELTKADMVQISGDGKKVSIEGKKTFNMPRQRGSKLELYADLWEYHTEVHFPEFRTEITYPEWGSGDQTFVMDHGRVFLSPCKATLNYTVSIE